MFSQDCIEEFKKVKKWRTISWLSIYASIPIALIYLFNKDLPSLIILIFLFFISFFSSFKYKCPACNKSLGINTKITYCNHCGIQLNSQGK